MSGLTTLKGQIKNPRSLVYRRLFIKRRLAGTALYESTWLDITKDVIKWGAIKKEADATRINQFKFNNINLVMDNSLGHYNQHTDENSLWTGYSDQQRTLIKIEAGFLYQTKSTSGIWSVTELPNANVVFSGFISGDINTKGDNQTSLPIVPLHECFRQFSARRLTGYNTSLTASDFMDILRDQQDTAGAYLFRPFFNNTTTSWNISSTTVQYTNLSSANAADLLESTAWDVVQKLAEAENHIPYVSGSGIFNFVPRSISTTTVYNFYGAGAFSSEYGQQIKKVNWFGKRYSKYYSRVSLKYAEADTSTSYSVSEATFRVDSASTPWILGERSLNIENLWVPSGAVADQIVAALFTEFSAIKTEMEFTTSFIPHLEIFDRVLITYDPAQPSENALWDVYNWADSISAADDLTWDASKGDSIRLHDTEFQLISIEMNLDTTECKFIGRM